MQLLTVSQICFHALDHALLLAWSQGSQAVSNHTWLRRSTLSFTSLSSRGSEDRMESVDLYGCTGAMASQAQPQMVQHWGMGLPGWTSPVHNLAELCGVEGMELLQAKEPAWVWGIASLGVAAWSLWISCLPRLQPHLTL